MNSEFSSKPDRNAHTVTKSNVHGTSNRFLGIRLGEEAEVVAVLLCEFNQRGAQRLGRLLDELLEVDHEVVVIIGALEDDVELLILDELERHNTSMQFIYRIVPTDRSQQ